jgi:hypothetical protein
VATRKSVASATKGLVFFLLLMSAFGAFASGRRITGTYSSLQYNAQSGDVLGYEVLIIPTDVGYEAVVQVAEGGPGQVYICQVMQKGDTISFDITLSSGAKGSFAGEVTGNLLVGDILSPSGKEHVQLKRGTSYWDK